MADRFEDDPPGGDDDEFGELLAEYLPKSFDIRAARDFALVFDNDAGRRVLTFLEQECLKPLPLDPQIPIYWHLFMDGRRSLLNYVKQMAKSGAATMPSTSNTVN